jgi:hypothetical protein
LHGPVDWNRELFFAQFHEGPVLKDFNIDRIKGNINFSGSLNEFVEVFADCIFVEAIDDSGFGLTAGGMNFGSHFFQRRKPVSGQEDPATFACEGPGYGTSEGAPCAIDHGGFVRQ